jgi:hypothetical protein
LIIEPKGYGQKNDGAKEYGPFFLPHHSFAWKLLLLERGTDGAIAGISGLSLAAGRFCFSVSPVVGQSESPGRRNPSAPEYSRSGQKNLTLPKPEANIPDRDISRKLPDVASEKHRSGKQWLPSTPLFKSDNLCVNVAKKRG